ncbi:MAG: hypothetical protein II875_06405 [Clostridia bacterium]|nr:hypothetical protein [Clostridia bacterium]
MNTIPIPIETERRFLIRMPDVEKLRAMEGCVCTEITQRYLLNDSATERIRKRVYADRTIYTHTLKKRISSMSSIEDEHEITRDEYDAFKRRLDPERHKIKKLRCAVPWQGHTAEIDIYPFWQKQAIMEIELKSEDDVIDLPDFVEIIREITGDRSYSNRSLSKKIPAED